jgi:hypothetical protein
LGNANLANTQRRSYGQDKQQECHLTVRQPGVA